MSTRAEMTRIIGYSLSQLRIENRHHEFEHLCRDLAGEFIARNILPATGPVAGSGDQGRDFETFPTYVHDRRVRLTGFAARAGNEIIAFACSVQHQGIAAKIMADVALICSSGTRVERVCFFSTEPIKVADRHMLEAGASREFGISLTIFDRPAIAELLSRPEGRWIAQTHLHVPLQSAGDQASAASNGAADVPGSEELRRTSIRQADHELAAALDVLAAASGKSIEEMTPYDFRLAFATRLRALYRLAGRPDIGAIAVKAGLERAKVADFLSGERRPSRSGVVAVVGALAEHALESGIEIPRHQLDIRAWERMWRVTRKSGMQKTVKNKAAIGSRL